MAVDEKQPISEGQAWFYTSDLPSDIVVDVTDIAFHLHKFPLMSKSRKLHRLITDQETALKDEDDDGGCEIEEAELCRVSFPEFPGGSEAFQTAARFCYGIKPDLTASNVAPLLCAAEFLEMTDDYCNNNLISMTESFLSHSVLNSAENSIKALRSCELLTPLAENLGIAQRCIESIASLASSGLFVWPVNDGGELASNLNLWNGIDPDAWRKISAGANSNPWFEDLLHLSVPLFKRLILAMRARDLSPEILESCLTRYALRNIPGASRSSRKLSSSIAASEKEQRDLLETVITNLPSEKTSRSTTTISTKFLFNLLRTVNILKASERCRDPLEKRIGSQLDEASLDDLLIPSYSYLNETLYDVDCIERILGYFLDRIEDRNVESLTCAGKLIDGYLSEIASDVNLKPDRFCRLAMALPEQARVFDDGLYRSVDIYLKTHPWIPEWERERMCGMMEYQKLTLEACTHAAQNEDLPLRAVVQVLFEQLQLRGAIAGTREDAVEVEESTTTVTWKAAVRENHVLRLDMDSMRTRMHKLERECSTIKKVLDTPLPRGGGWSRRFGCKFKTQVCDSQESTVVEARRGRHHHHQS